MEIIIFALEVVFLIAMLYAMFKLKKQIAFTKKATLDYADNLKAEISARIDNLEKGLSPDYEKAKEAAKNLDTFNETINTIWAYDPYSAIHKKDGDRD